MTETERIATERREELLALQLVLKDIQPKLHVPVTEALAGATDNKTAYRTLWALTTTLAQLQGACLKRSRDLKFVTDDQVMELTQQTLRLAGIEVKTVKATPKEQEKLVSLFAPTGMKLSSQ